MADPLFVTDTVEGLGLDRPLTANEIDLNNIAWLDRVRLLEAAIIASGGGIVNVEQTTDRLIVFTLSDASTYTLLLPLARPSPRGEWQNNTLYLAYDWVTVRGIGTFVANVGHTSPVAPTLFNPQELGESDELLWTQVGGRDSYAPGYAYSLDLDMAAPDSGEITFDDTVLADVTELRIHYSSDDAVDHEPLIVTWDDAGGNNKGRVTISDANAPESNFVVFDIIGDLTDSGTYATFPVVYVHDAGVLTDGSLLAVQFTPNGGQGRAAAPTETISDATYVPDVANDGNYNRCTHIDGCVVTLPNTNDGDIPIDYEEHFRQCETEAIFIESETIDVLINGMDGFLNHTGGKGSVVTVKKVGIKEWDLYGRLATSTGDSV